MPVGPVTPTGGAGLLIPEPLDDGDLVNDDYELAEISAAKNIAYNSLGRALERSGIDAESEDSPVDLVNLAHEVVDSLVAAGVSIPEQIIDPFSGMPAQDVPITETGLTDAETIIVLRKGAAALAATEDPFNGAVANWLLAESTIFANLGPFSELVSMRLAQAGQPAGLITIARDENGDMLLRSSSLASAVRVAQTAIDEVGDSE
jgi:hypothetical protein